MRAKGGFHRVPSHHVVDQSAAGTVELFEASHRQLAEEAAANAEEVPDVWNVRTAKLRSAAEQREPRGVRHMYTEPRTRGRLPSYGQLGLTKIYLFLLN